MCMYISIVYLLRVILFIFSNSFITMHESPSFNATPLITSDFRCTDIVKYYYIVSLKRGHLCYKVTLYYRIAFRGRTTVSR